MSRRSKRKASAIATQKNAELASATAAAASTPNTEETVEDSLEEATAEVEDFSDGEECLHGPCNMRPIGSDENPRSV